MKHLVKKFLATVFAMALGVTSVTAYAATGGAPAPRWTYMTLVSGGMEVDDNNIASINVICGSDTSQTNRIKAKCELQQLKGSWETIKTWTEENKKESVILYDKEYAIAKKYSYRLKITAYAYKDTTLKETVTDYFDYGYYQ